MKAFVVLTTLLFHLALISAFCPHGEYSSEESEESSVEVQSRSFRLNVGTCRLPAAVGPCRARIRRYFFNKFTGKCEQFFYGGCRGNKNNFETMEECLQTCTDVCRLPSVVGPCEAAMPRYFYNSKKGKCEKFVYGGCGTNGNNFLTKESCEQRCRPVNICRLPRDFGSCKGSFPRYFFNWRTRRCELFSYGGCDGNGNNFLTINECRRRCY